MGLKVLFVLKNIRYFLFLAIGHVLARVAGTWYELYRQNIYYKLLSRKLNNLDDK